MHAIRIDINNAFKQLESGVRFEPITNGRLGANLIDSADGLIPIVRTTTRYNLASQKMSSIHIEIMRKITTEMKMMGMDAQFNTGLIEIYDDRYRSMGYHTDQMTDLADSSWIALYSCYELPTDMHRVLRVQNKCTDGLEIDYTLDEGRVILFNLETNSKHLHKIILDKFDRTRWLGITFRLSKTYVKFMDERMYFIEMKDIVIDISQQLSLATKKEESEFYSNRSLENRVVEHKWPKIYYTISAGDLRPVI